MCQVPLQLQVTGTGRTAMVDASPTMTAARLSRVIAAQTGVPHGSFALYYGSRPMCGSLKESGVASGSTIELKFRGRGGGPEPQATNSLEVEIEPQPTSMERQSSVSGATKIMRGYDRDGNGIFSRDEVREMASDFLQEKQTRRLTTKIAIVIGVILLLVVVMNAGLTAAIVFLSKDVKVADGKLIDANTNEELMVSSTDTMVSAEGDLVDRKHGTSLKTAASEQEIALDSRLPDSSWTELRHATFKSQEGGLLHVHVQVRCVPPSSLAKPPKRQKNQPYFAWQAVSRVIDKHALHGSYVKIHTSVGTITLDGSILTFADGMEGVFKNAGFAVVSRQRRLQGVFELIGLFNSVAAFEGWNTTYDLPPKIPTTFEAVGHMLYACQYGDLDLCDEVGLPGDSLARDDGGAKHAKVEMKVYKTPPATS